MTTYHGRADICSNPLTTVALYNEIYTAIIQFMTGSLAASMGIQTVELNRGVSGRGLDYWDTAGNSGRGTWGVFRFLSSSYGQFDLAIYCYSGSALQTSFQPGLNGGSGLQGQIGLSVAAHPSGTLTLPWNGSSSSFTNGTVGTPRWKAAADGRLMVLPRSNNASDGSNATARDAMVDLIATDTQPWRAHLIVSQDSFSFIHASPDNQAYKFTHVGSYTPRSGTSIDSPYFMISTAGNTEGPKLYTNTYGTTTANASTSRDGGIAHPSLFSGSRTVTFVTVGNSEVDQFLGSFNSYVNTNEFLGLYVAIKDGTDHGILGIANNVALAFGISPHAVTPGSGSATFGGVTTAAAYKFVVPWFGSPPGTFSSRVGREW